MILLITGILVYLVLAYIGINIMERWCGFRDLPLQQQKNCWCFTCYVVVILELCQFVVKYTIWQ